MDANRWQETEPAGEGTLPYSDVGKPAVFKGQVTMMALQAGSGRMAEEMALLNTRVFEASKRC